MRTGQCLRRFESAHGDGVTSVALSREGSHVLSGSYDGLARVHGIKSGKMLKEFRGHTSYVNDAVSSPDGSQARCPARLRAGAGNVVAGPQSSQDMHGLHQDQGAPPAAI